MRHDLLGEVKQLSETTALSLMNCINELKMLQRKDSPPGAEQNINKRIGYNIFSPFRTATDRQVIISCRIMRAEYFCVPEIQKIYQFFSIQD